MFSGCYTYTLYKKTCVGCNRFNVSISLSSSAEYPFKSAFIKLKSRLKDIVCGTMTGWALTQIGRCWVCGIGPTINLLHMFAMLSDANMRYVVYPFFQLALLKDFGSLASWMSVRSVQPLLHCYLLCHNPMRYCGYCNLRLLCVANHCDRMLGVQTGR